MKSAPLVKQPIHWVETQSDLLNWCTQWQQKKLLAVDTEFMRSQTYYPKAALLQVNDGENNVLIDPTANIDFSALKALFADPAITKALHSCSEDLEVFHRIFSTVPVNILDTQIAAAALGYGFSIGYGKLVEAILKIELPKSETRSDWLQRPLSQSQISYAAVDVEYLYTLAELFITALEEKNRLHWVREDCDKLLNDFSSGQNPELAYLRVKSAWKLDAQQLACLMDLFAWRERKAQNRDVPRNRVVKENTLFQLALRRPSHAAQLRNYEGITDRIVRADGGEILNIIENSLSIAEADLPDIIPHPPGGADNRVIKALREKVIALAESLNVAPELFAKKRDYESLIRNPEQLPESLEGWRKDVVGKQLLQWLRDLRLEETRQGETNSKEEGSNQ